MFVLLNVAMGGNLGGGIDPNLNKATMEVDYLAHCTSTNQNNANRCNENTPTVYADDDNDGIANDIDNCPNTLLGESVDEYGCALDAENIAPVVSLSMTQNNVLVSSIDIADGIVEIIANGTDENTDDILSYTWIMAGAIPSATIDGASVIFDPSSMVVGSFHQIELTVNDNGNPVLSVSSSIQFSVKESQATPTVEDKDSSKNSGGLFSYLILLLLTVISARNVTSVRDDIK